MARARRVLVVDDDVEAREGLCESLRAWGYEVDAAENGCDTLEKLDDEPDIVVADLRLPDSDACDVIRLVRGYAGESVYLIAFSGWHHHRMTALAAGADAFILKSDIDALEHALAAYKVAEVPTPTKSASDDIGTEGRRIIVSTARQQ